MWEQQRRNGQPLPIGRTADTGPTGAPSSTPATPDAADATAAPPDDSAAKTATPQAPSLRLGERAGERGPAKTATPSSPLPSQGKGARGLGESPAESAISLASQAGGEAIAWDGLPAVDRVADAVWRWPAHSALPLRTRSGGNFSLAPWEVQRKWKASWPSHMEPRPVLRT